MQVRNPWAIAATVVGCAGLSVLSVTNPVTQTAANAAPPAVKVAAGSQATAVVQRVALAETGTLKGKITLKGDAPKPKVLIKKGGPNDAVKPEDREVCEAEEVLDETLLVDADGGIANVCIYLAKAPADYKHTPPKDTIVFDQKGCKFLPHVLPVQVGQTVLVKSQDAVAHNTHTLPVRAKAFNQSVKPKESDGVKLVYDKADRTPVSVVCDFHKWMKAYHLVCDHPFMAVTNEKGEFTIADLPAGKHEFVVWHEKKGYLNKKWVVTIKAGENTQDVSFAPKDLE